MYRSNYCSIWFSLSSQYVCIEICVLDKDQDISHKACLSSRQRSSSKRCDWTGETPHKSDLDMERVGVREGVETKMDYQLQSDISLDFVFRELIRHFHLSAKSGLQENLTQKCWKIKRMTLYTYFRMWQEVLTQLPDLKNKRDKPANKRKLVKITMQNFLEQHRSLIILEVFRGQTHGVG